MFTLPIPVTVPAPIPALRLLAALLIAVALGGCRSGDAGSVDTVQVEQQALTDGPPLQIVRLLISAHGSGLWERVLMLRETKRVAVTHLVRAARIECAEGKTCRVFLLSPGALWPKTYEIDPGRFLPPGVSETTLANPSRGWTVPLQSDDAFEGLSGLKPASRAIAGEAALVASYVKRHFSRHWEEAPLAAWSALVIFTACWCLLMLIRWLLPTSWLANWSRNHSLARLIAMGSYAFAILYAVPFFLKALTEGPTATAREGAGLFGVQVVYLSGETPLAPVLSMLSAFAGIAAFQFVAWMIRGLFAPPRSRDDAA